MVTLVTELVIFIYFADILKVENRDQGVFSQAFQKVKDWIKTLPIGFVTVFKKRPYNDRLILLMLMLAFLLEMSTNMAGGNFFMYCRLKFNFRMEDFSTFMAIAGFVGLTGQYVFVPLFIKVLRFSDVVISLLGKCYY